MRPKLPRFTGHFFAVDDARVGIARGVGEIFHRKAGELSSFASFGFRVSGRPTFTRHRTLVLLLGECLVFVEAEDAGEPIGSFLCEWRIDLPRPELPLSVRRAGT